MVIKIDSVERVPVMFGAFVFPLYSVKSMVFEAMKLRAAAYSAEVATSATKAGSRWHIDCDTPPRGKKL